MVGLSLVWFPGLFRYDILNLRDFGGFDVVWYFRIDLIFGFSGYVDDVDLVVFALMDWWFVV